jgi:phage shock protein A
MTGPKAWKKGIADLRAADKIDAELEAMKAALKAKGRKLEISFR